MGHLPYQLVQGVFFHQQYVLKKWQHGISAIPADHQKKIDVSVLGFHKQEWCGEEKKKSPSETLQSTSRPSGPLLSVNWFGLHGKFLGQFHGTPKLGCWMNFWASSWGLPYNLQIPPTEISDDFFEKKKLDQSKPPNPHIQQTGNQKYHDHLSKQKRIPTSSLSPWTQSLKLVGGFNCISKKLWGN